MCGIIGVAAAVPVRDRSWICTGRDAMRHRGPDDNGEWWSRDGCVGLAHRRLSIIDLSAAARQPMHSVDGRLCIVYNGEIYNFRELRRHLSSLGHAFKTQSDTEVIIAAYIEWGVACLSRLNGMFALAIYDDRKKQLFLARDRAGEKPLYYVYQDRALRFASELKGLMADKTMSRRIEPDALACYLGMGFVPGDRCILQDVKKLPPAHAMLFNLDDGRSRVWRYWHLPEVEASTDETALLDELEQLLEDSVRRQLVADVPVGILLSGGMDSSLVTAMAVRAKQNVMTFTVRFPGHEEFDETDHARLIARHFRTTHVELEAATATVDLLPLLARQFDEPIADSSVIPTYLVSRTIRDNCAVALGGDGGDELFGGYHHYSRLLWLQRHVSWVPQFLRSHVASVAAGLLPIGFKGRNWLQAMAVNWRGGLPLIGLFFDSDAQRLLVDQVDVDGRAFERIREDRIPRTPNLLERATRMDFENYLPEDILVKVDRASMLSSLEVRAPMLDFRLIEFAFRKVPSQLKATVSERKLLLRELARRLLPPQFDLKRKQGFSIPLGSWIRSGPWRGFLRDLLLARDGFFSRRVVDNLFRGQRHGMANGERLFALAIFELWRREYHISI